jgi:hypothetical protein
MSANKQESSSFSLNEQRLALRQKLQAQRVLIQRQLEPAPAASNAYPRSNIMRFFAERPGLVKKLAFEFSALLVGGRFIKSMSKAVGFAKILQSSFNNKF